MSRPVLVIDPKLGITAEELEIDVRRDAQGNEQFIMRRKTGR